MDCFRTDTHSGIIPMRQRKKHPPAVLRKESYTKIVSADNRQGRVARTKRRNFMFCFPDIASIVLTAERTVIYRAALEIADDQALVEVRFNAGLPAFAGGYLGNPCSKQSGIIIVTPDLNIQIAVPNIKDIRAPPV